MKDETIKYGTHDPNSKTSTQYPEAVSSAPVACSTANEIKQTIYEHGGSRIWIELDGQRNLLCDTYHTKELAVVVRGFIEHWWKQYNACDKRLFAVRLIALL